jgi:hypothetical protein
VYATVIGLEGQGVSARACIAEVGGVHDGQGYRRTGDWSNPSMSDVVFESTRLRSFATNQKLTFDVMISVDPVPVPSGQIVCHVHIT